MINDRMLLFAKLLVLSMVICVPLAPPGAYQGLFSKNCYFLTQGLMLVVLGIACAVDIPLGLLFAALILSAAVQQRYGEKI